MVEIIDDWDRKQAMNAEHECNMLDIVNAHKAFMLGDMKRVDHIKAGMEALGYVVLITAKRCSYHHPKVPVEGGIHWT